MQDSKSNGFIVDLGETSYLKDATGKVVMEIHRYGWWGYDESKGKNQCKDTDNDVMKLIERHGECPIVKLERRRQNA